MAEVGKTAFITGGASGIGRAVAEAFLSRGANVFILDLDAEATQLFVNEQISRGAEDRIAFTKADVTSFEQQARAFDEAIEKFGDLDYVCPIAGIAERGWMSNDVRRSTWEKPDLSVIDVDLTGVLYTCSLAIQHYRKRPISSDGWKGKIICVSSICGIYAVSTLPVYTAAKHGVVGYVRSHGRYLLEESIALNAVCPGVVRTNLSPPEFFDKLEKQNLLTPMSDVIRVFEQLMSTYDVSGEVFEVGPRETLTRSAPEPANSETEVVNGLLTERSRPFHLPTGLRD